jgi:hypothetical protein
VSAEVDGEELVVLNNIVLLKVSAEVTLLAHLHMLLLSLLRAVIQKDACSRLLLLLHKFCAPYLIRGKEVRRENI